MSPAVRTQIAGDARAALFERMYVLALATWVQAAYEALAQHCQVSIGSGALQVS